MKAVIVIDLNDTTLREWDTDTSKCWAKVIVNTPIKGGAHGIGCVYANNNVELKPMPQKKDLEAYKVPPKFFSHESYRYFDEGYNACIDEILGVDDD